MSNNKQEKNPNTNNFIFNDYEWNLNNPQDIEKLIDESKKAAFEYYKEHRNLNILYYNTNDKFLQKKLVDWQREFHQILKKDEKRNIKNEIQFNTAKDDLYENKYIQKTKSNKINAGKSTNKLPTSKIIHSSTLKTHSFLLGNTLTSQLNATFGGKIKNEKEEDFLDLDEMVEIEYPKEYNSEITEGLLKELGGMLQENRDAVKKGLDSRSKMSNDDFRLMLCALRLKKKALKEKNPYYCDKLFDLKEVYTSNVYEEDDDNNVSDYVRDFIEAEMNN
jgi:hypothetical protein